MKSNGKEQEIHVSKQAFAELEMTDEFNLDYRGKVNLKGRGDMDCYWLRGMKRPLLAQEASSRPSGRYHTSAYGVPRKLTTRHTVEDFRWSGNSFGAVRPTAQSRTSTNTREFLTEVDTIIIPLSIF